MGLVVSPWRFSFVAVDPVRFPPSKAGNVLRGALGTFLQHQPEYASVFEPSISNLPSGLGDPPRPFVLRAAHLDGASIEPGAHFHFDINLIGHCPAEPFAIALERAASDGLGAQRGRACLESASPLQPVGLSFAPSPAAAVTVHFLTPTELKHDATLAEAPDFPILFARSRDRASTLAALYGDGPLDIDFRMLGEHAQRITMTHCSIQHIPASRRSSRTAQVHPIGGFVGTAAYQGDLGEFIPFLKVAEWVGVGRQTVWGKGQIAVTAAAIPLS